MIFLSTGVTVQASDPKADPSRLTLDRIFGSKEFEAATVPAHKWLKRSSGYAVLEPTRDGRELARYDPATGRRDVLVPGHWFIPAGESKPLNVEDYSFSHDESLLLIYTIIKDAATIDIYTLS